jgi:CBS domain-containing protein
MRNRNLGLDITPQMVVREIMSSPVITVDHNQSIVEAAELMERGDVGAVIVMEEGKPLGILTEHDIVIRVVAKGFNPMAVKAKEVMSTPLRTVEPDLSITDAARIMSRYKIRRLGVVYKGELTGIVTSRDIMGVTPELFEILEERSRIEPEEELREGRTFAGHCDRCGSWSDSLTEAEGEFLCEDCRLEKEEA